MRFSKLQDFTEIWLVDAEFTQPPGERVQDVHCLVAKEYRSGRTQRFETEDLRRLKQAPFLRDRSSLMVTYFASAEVHCFASLGWPFPPYLLDLFTEFRVFTNGRRLYATKAEQETYGNTLLGALRHFQLGHIDAGEKATMRKLAMRGGPFSKEEREALLAYCESDVEALFALLPKMEPLLDLPRALVRGHYMRASAMMEFHGIPLDMRALTTLREHWDNIQEALVARLDTGSIYVGRSFRADRWIRWTQEHGICWPTLESGAPDLKSDTFRELARIYPQVATYHELRYSMSQLRLHELAVGHDGRNRVLLSPFSAKTSRHTPSNSRFIFGPATWIRSLIQPPPGYAFAYIDFAQQEFGVAAALSQDDNMLHAYRSGDPYLAFAKLAGAVPPDATRATHKKERERFKACVLGVQYAMGEESLAVRIEQPPIYARELLDAHRRAFAQFWRWSDRTVDYAFMYNQLETRLGWRWRIEGGTNPRSVRNFPMQANGAEILRLSICYAVEAGVEVVAPIHDALAIVAPVSSIHDAVAMTQRAMERASIDLLDGFPLRTEATVVQYPDHYQDERGVEMWETVWGIIRERERRVSSRVTKGAHGSILR